MVIYTHLDPHRESNKSVLIITIHLIQLNYIVFMCIFIHYFRRRGQLGLGALDPEEEPILIEALSGIKVNLIRNIFKTHSHLSNKN